MVGFGLSRGMLIDGFGELESKKQALIIGLRNGVILRWISKLARLRSQTVGGGLDLYTYFSGLLCFGTS